MLSGFSLSLPSPLCHCHCPMGRGSSRVTSALLQLGTVVAAVGRFPLPGSGGEWLVCLSTCSQASREHFVGTRQRGRTHPLMLFPAEPSSSCSSSGVVRTGSGIPPPTWLARNSSSDRWEKGEWKGSGCGAEHGRKMREILYLAAAAASAACFQMRVWLHYAWPVNPPLVEENMLQRTGYWSRSRDLCYIPRSTKCSC